VPNQTYTPSQMAAAIASIGQATLQTKTTTQNGTVTPDAGYDGLSEVVVNVPTGGGDKTEVNDVNFIDYDGTIVHSYTAAEFAALTAMPENPSHAGLTSQGWNWTLAKAQAYVAKYGKLWMGQMYVTDDGKTRVYIHLEEGRLEPYLGIAVNGTAVIDWGDDSEPDTVTGNDVYTVINTQHVYPAPGKYVITIDVTGSLGITGGGAGSQLLWKTSGSL